MTPIVPLHVVVLVAYPDYTGFARVGRFRFLGENLPGFSSFVSVVNSSDMHSRVWVYAVLFLSWHSSTSIVTGISQIRYILDH